ncbi:hypothetical protein CK203_039750 [Vitis vinifera]|uniref:DUF659 domain-containing protein n=1 Tax=Vitis vinifera TaxID=29760 RepID=A0A438HTY9_VITVI|nr:hypothetical protein CK203_039750 [Vitis vinifera]
MYSKGLPFNMVNDPYWVPMIDAIANFGPSFKPPSMHELRTWILKEEVNDINIMMEEHKKAWKQYGCSIMSNSWTDGKNEIDSDDEWIAEKEAPLLLLDLCWLKDNELFNVDVIRVVSSKDQEPQELSASHSKKKKHDEFASKEKEMNLIPIHEDEELDEMGGFDSGNLPTIDTLG